MTSASVLFGCYTFLCVCSDFSSFLCQAQWNSFFFVSYCLHAAKLLMVNIHQIIVGCLCISYYHDISFTEYQVVDFLCGTSVCDICTPYVGFWHKANIRWTTLCHGSCMHFSNKDLFYDVLPFATLRPYIEWSVMVRKQCSCGCLRSEILLRLRIQPLMICYSPVHQHDRYQWRGGRRSSSRLFQILSKRRWLACSRH